MRNFRRYWRGLKWHLILRQLPHGLIHWRYLLPRTLPQVHCHRGFWWNQPKPLPTILWVVLEMILWFRWILWGSWKTSLKWVRRKGKSYQYETGISLKRQYYLLQKLALSWCIHPCQSYQFDLLEHPEKALDYVFYQETSGYHSLKNHQRKVSQESLSCLQDKNKLAHLFADSPIQVVTTIQMVHRHQNISLWDILPESLPCFIKSRHGNQGRGAFKIWQQKNQWQGQSLQGELLHSPQILASYWQKLLAEDDVLVQPLLRNHPDLSCLTEIEDVITFRVISYWQKNELVIYHQSLEIPCQDRSGIAYLFLIVTDEGELHPIPRLDRIEQQRLNQMCESLSPLPYYREIIEQTRLAHRYFPDIHAIAWDWVITPTGPVLLEGNIGWRTAFPQQLNGPLCAVDEAAQQ